MDEVLMKVFSDDSAMWRGWKRTGLLRGSMYAMVLVVPQRVDTVKYCVRKIGLDIRQARRMVQDRSE